MNSKALLPACAFAVGTQVAVVAAVAAAHAAPVGVRDARDADDHAEAAAAAAHGAGDHVADEESRQRQSALPAAHQGALWTFAGEILTSPCVEATQRWARHASAVSRKDMLSSIVFIANFSRRDFNVQKQFTKRVGRMVPSAFTTNI